MTPASFLEQFDVMAESPNGVPKLRELILQLAVRGKLVPQDPSEEPASVLIRRAEATKQRMYEAGMTSRPPSVPAVHSDEVSGELPSQWAWSRLANLGIVNPRNEVADQATVAFCPMALIPQNHGVAVQYEQRSWRQVKKGYTHFANGDVVVAKITPCFQNGKAAVMRGLPNGVGAGTTELHVFRPIIDAVLPDYVLLVLKSPRFVSGGIATMTGTAGQQRVSKEYFAGFAFPLPPLAEQHRIVTKVDDLMMACDQLEERQRRRARLRAHASSSVLSRLTEPSDDTSLADNWQRLSDHLKLLYHSPESIVELRNTILQLAVQSRLSPDELNPSRRVVRVGDFIRFQNGYAFKSEWFTPTGVHLLRNVNIRHGDIDWTDSVCLPLDRVEEFRRFLLNAGDVVLSLDRPLISTGLKAARVRRSDLPALLLQRVARAQIATEHVDPEYFYLWLQSPSFTNAIDPGRSNGVPHISTTQVERLPFYLPSLAAQRRTVMIASELMALCDALASRLTLAREKAVHLAASVVHHLGAP